MVDTSSCNNWSPKDTHTHTQTPLTRAPHAAGNVTNGEGETERVGGGRAGRFEITAALVVFSCGCLCAGGRVRACVRVCVAGKKKNRGVGGGGRDRESESQELHRQTGTASPRNWPGGDAGFRFGQTAWRKLTSCGGTQTAALALHPGEVTTVVFQTRPGPVPPTQFYCRISCFFIIYLFIVVVRCCFFFFFFFSSSSHPDNYNRTGWLGVTETLTKLLTYRALQLWFLFCCCFFGPGWRGRVGFVGFVSCSCWWWVFCWC